MSLRVVNGYIRSFPAGMRVFTARGSVNAAVVINDTRLDCLCIESLTNDRGAFETVVFRKHAFSTCRRLGVLYRVHG